MEHQVCPYLTGTNVAAKTEENVCFVSQELRDLIAAGKSVDFTMLDLTEFSKPYVPMPMAAIDWAEQADYAMRVRVRF